MGVSVDANAVCLRPIVVEDGQFTGHTDQWSAVQFHGAQWRS